MYQVHHEKLSLLSYCILTTYRREVCIALMEGELTEQVRSFAAMGTEVHVTFAISAPIYHLSKDREDLALQVANLATAWQKDKYARVRVRGTEIVSIEVL